LTDKPADEQLMIARARGLTPGQFALPAGDALTALLLVAVLVMSYIPLANPEIGPRVGQLAADLTFGVYFEAAFVFLQWTLSDIATRLKKRPPVWAMVLIAAFLLMMYPESRGFLMYAQDRGIAVLIPLLFSVGSRFSTMWTMPSRPPIEKLAARAQSEARMYAAVALFGAITLLHVAGAVIPQLAQMNISGSNMPIIAAGAVYFAIAAFDDWRVRRAPFARRPTVLFTRKRVALEELDMPLL
jgi:hypothetical protein